MGVTFGLYQIEQHKWQTLLSAKATRNKCAIPLYLNTYLVKWQCALINLGLFWWVEHCVKISRFSDLKWVSYMACEYSSMQGKWCGSLSSRSTGLAKNMYIGLLMCLNLVVKSTWLYDAWLMRYQENSRVILHKCWFPKHQDITPSWHFHSLV